MTYKRRNNEILNESGKQIAVVLATNCSARMAVRMAAYCVDQLNAEEKWKEIAKIRVEKKKKAATDGA